MNSFKKPIKFKLSNVLTSRAGYTMHKDGRVYTLLINQLQERIYIQLDNAIFFELNSYIF